MRIVVLFAIFLAKILMAGGVSYLSAAAAADCDCIQPVTMLWMVMFLYAAAFAVVKIDSSLTSRAGQRDDTDSNM